MRHQATLLAIAWVFFEYSASAQQQKIPIYIEHAGDDPAGQQLAYNLRETVNRSTRYSLSGSYKNSLVAIRLVTMNPDEDNRGVWTVYSKTITIYNKDGFDYYITSSVGTCGTTVTLACAQRIMGSIDSEIQELVK